MKQFTLIVECIIKDDAQPVFMVRDPRSGNVVKILKSADELASFFSETANKVSTSNFENHD